MTKYLVLDKSQLAKPVEIETKQGEYGVEIEVERGTERAHIQVDYFAGVLRLRVYDEAGHGLLNQAVELLDAMQGGYR